MDIINHYIKLHSTIKYAERFTAVSNFGEAVNLAIKNYLKSEIIGQWLFSFTSDLIGVQLQALGFWYSFKHDAWVFSGSPKQGMADDETLDEIRTRLGSQKL
jgi:hypothetical protein